MNENDVKECHTKLESVLNAFLIPKCRISNDVYLEMLMSHLYSAEEYKRSEIILAWIDKVVTKLSPEDDLNPSIFAFFIRLLALIIENEWTFASIKEKNIFEKIQDALKDNQKLQTASIKLANILLLTSIGKHSIGLHWIKQTKSWLTVIEYCQKNHTLYVVREAMKFLFNILYNFTTIMKEDLLTEEILNEIFKPLTLCTNDENNIVSVDDSDLQQSISPTLNLICYILEKSIESNDCVKIHKHILNDLKIELTMWRLADMTHDHLFLETISRVFVLCNFSQLEFVKKDSKNTDLDFNVFSLNFFNLMNFCISRRSYMNVFKVAELNHIMWKKLGTRAPEEIILDQQAMKFEDQFLILQILPILHFVKTENHKGREWVENYLLKLFNISSEHTTRLCYGFRELMYTTEHVDDLACKSIQGILSLKNILHRDRAILVFQALIFALKGYAPEVCSYYESQPKTNTDILIKNPNLLSAILNGLHTLISHYKITWKECIESTALLNFMLALLNNPNMLTRQSVQALKVTQLSIEHFLAPNLALLVDTLKGSGMELLGPMIMKRLHDKDWEARDSTIELLLSMVSISDFKFPAFQQHILDNGICPVIVSMAKNDSEAYVRASALKCLAQMVKIKLFWDHCLKTTDLCAHVINVINAESEGVVRREAVELITILYDQQKISRNCLDHIFSVLAYCSVNDLYWEVKTSAIKFWKVVICRQCKHQGMIDGTFPAVTFSIEYKKIVTLNEKEILLRLKKVLDELSMRGCLGVFLACLDDDCDLEVVRLTVKLVKKLIFFLNKYNYMENREKIFSIPTIPKPVVDTNYSEFKREVTNNDTPQVFNNADSSGINNTNNTKTSKLNSEEILDFIVDSDDVNLLTTAYENQMNVNNLQETKIDENYYKKFTIPPNEFLDKVTSIDLDDLIKKKNDWIIQTESFNSLLDDILLSFQYLIHNDADCY